MKNELQVITSATRQGRRRWFSVGIFPLGLLFGLTGNRPQSAPACSFLRCTAMLTHSTKSLHIQESQFFKR